MVCGRYLDNNNFIGRIPEGLYRHPFLKELYVGFRIPIYILYFQKDFQFTCIVLCIY
jgi:hypothetical protein